MKERWALGLKERWELGLKERREESRFKKEYEKDKGSRLIIIR